MFWEWWHLDWGLVAFIYSCLQCLQPLQCSLCLQCLQEMVESRLNEVAFIYSCLLWAVKGVSKTCLIRVELTWFLKCLDQTLVQLWACADENDETKREGRLHSSIALCCAGRLKEPSFTASLHWESWFLNLNTSRQKSLTKQTLCVQILCLLWMVRGVSRTRHSPHLFNDNLGSIFIWIF